MELHKPDQPVIEIRPATIFAFIKISGLLLLAIAFLFIAWHFMPCCIWMSIATLLFAWYRFLYIRQVRYTITTEIIQIRRGLFYKRIDTVELFRVKDYILTRPPILQLFRLMDLTLKTTDPENPVIWLRGIPVSDLLEQLRERVLETRRTNRIFEIN